MTATRIFVRTIVAAIAMAAATPASAQPVGPSLADLPPAAPAPTVRTPAEIDAELAAMNDAITSALEAAPAASVATDQSASRTPLRVHAAVETGAPLANPDRAERPGTGGLARTLLALGGVLLLIIALAWVFKRVARATGGLSGSLGAGGRAPAGVVEVLARYPLASRHTLVVLRFDRRVLLCSLTGGSRSSGAGMTVLTELDDPEDVASILVKTRDEAGESIARSFERSLRDAERAGDESFERAAVRIPRPVATADQARGAYTATAARRGDDAGGLRRGLEALWTGGRR